jgi:hypothetical protein
MSNMVPGRPRRQQAYRRSNTSLTLMSAADSDPDPYISCTSIMDKFGNTSNGGNKDTSSYHMTNGSPRKSSGGTSGGLKDFLLGRSSTNRKDSSKDPDVVPQWSVQESVIDDLKISTIPRQPKYSYLIGKASQKDDFWRKSNAVSIVNNNVYSRPPPSSDVVPGNSYFLPQHNSSSSKRLNDYHNQNSVQSAAYEDRISTALRKAPAAPGGGSTYQSSSAVQKSKSYSNFDFVRRDLNFQVRVAFTFDAGAAQVCLPVNPSQFRVQLELFNHYMHA